MEVAEGERRIGDEGARRGRAETKKAPVGSIWEYKVDDDASVELWTA
jgi:hypothetical protein